MPFGKKKKVKKINLEELEDDEEDNDEVYEDDDEDDDEEQKPVIRSKPSKDEKSKEKNQITLEEIRALIDYHSLRTYQLNKILMQNS